jgi:uncharacterized membrane protein YkvA (DUF1232 family)
MAKLDKEKIENYIKGQQERFKESDFKKVVDEEKNIFEKIANEGPLKDYFEKAKLLFNMVRDFYRGDYRDISYMNMALIGAIFLYVLSPIDLIPDFIPMAGYLDDAAVIAYGLKRLNTEIEKYEAWKKNKENNSSTVNQEDFAEQDNPLTGKPVDSPQGL